MSSAGDLRGYFDPDGRLTLWPSRKHRGKQLAVLHRLSEPFRLGRTYSEREVNEILKSRLVISDYALIRRELFEARLLDRTPDGRAYWRRAEASPEADREEA